MSKYPDAILSISVYISFVIDGAYQSTYGLPWFSTEAKDQIGDGISVQLVGLLGHEQVNKSRLFTMTDEHQTSTNHIIEYLHRAISELIDERPSPKVLYIQLDDC